MPTLTIDERTIAAAEGATILDAARASGIEIPTLCWYPRLPNVASCRVCLVSVQGSGKMLPACATPAAEGMVVRGQKGFDVGDKVRVKLVAADPQKSYIDFEGQGERGN